MQIVEITESKVEKMSDYAEKMLKYGGKSVSYTHLTLPTIA